MTVYEMWQGCRNAGEAPTITVGVVRVLVVENPDQTVDIFFPGTGEGLSGVLGKALAWILNGLYPTVGGVHVGFAVGVASVYLPLRRMLGKIDPIEVRWHGYSQGGALAQVAGEKFGLYMKNARTVYTFAAPRAFRWWFPNRIRGRNYVNGNDLIARLPFVWMFFKGGLKREHIGKQRFFPSVLDHFPDRYEKAIMEYEDA